jgi:hypothetical protein
MLPTTKELVAIYLIPKIVNNEHVQSIPNNIAEAVNKLINDLKEKENNYENDASR